MLEAVFKLRKLGFRIEAAQLMQFQELGTENIDYVEKLLTKDLKEIEVIGDGELSKKTTTKANASKKEKMYEDSEKLEHVQKLLGLVKDDKIATIEKLLQIIKDGKKNTTGGDPVNDSKLLKIV